MATIASSVPRVRSTRIPPILSVAALCLASAALYGWMRIPLGNAQFESFRDRCTRFEMAPRDWPCAIGHTHIDVSLVAFLAADRSGARDPRVLPVPTAH